jgi:anthranilate/para-aminobenzoate synthase component II
MGPRVLVIDNYDSFVYNLVQYLGELGADPRVHRHDALTLEDAEALEPDAILISPGPAVRGRWAVERPHHPLRRAGAPSSGLPRPPVHRPGVRGGRGPGRPGHAREDVRHPPRGQGVFEGLPDPLEATRYHSLVVDAATLPDELEVTARTEDGVIMGLRHREHDVEGVQFHPESILTGSGHDLLRNFLARAG